MLPIGIDRNRLTSGLFSHDFSAFSLSLHDFPQLRKFIIHDPGKSVTRQSGAYCAHQIRQAHSPETLAKTPNHGGWSRVAPGLWSWTNCNLRLQKLQHNSCVQVNQLLAGSLELISSLVSVCEKHDKNLEMPNKNGEL